MDRIKFLLVGSFFLSIVSLFLEQIAGEGPLLIVFTNVIDFLIVVLIIAEIVTSLRQSLYPRLYLRKNVLSFLLAAGFVALFAYNKLVLFLPGLTTGFADSKIIVLIRNGFLIWKIYGRFRRISAFLASLSRHPAQTILVSFAVVIIIGALLLMLPFTVGSGNRISFLDSLFTATSSVCVTGLIVVDTAVYFSEWGQVFILILIQIGGLGIMILSFVSIYILRRSMSVEDKMLISFILNEQDMRSIKRSLGRIVMMTFGIEAAGALLLLLGFFNATGSWSPFIAVFHAVSAFCNAGFSLFTDSLEGFVSDPFINFTVCGLIILGGAGFAVVSDSAARIGSSMLRPFRRRKRTAAPLSVNTGIVLSASAILIISGFMIVYGLEHSGLLRGRPLGEQYLSAFFQSVTLRTAGFNTLPIGVVSTAGALVMIIFMFIGGASGSTAGGIKVNTAAVIGAYLLGKRDRSGGTILWRTAVDTEHVTRALLIAILGIFGVALGTILLSVSESAPLVDILFETTSAFGTVGLSRGLTPSLTGFGKVVIILLMFIGRVGPLTIFAAASGSRRQANVSYPRAEVLLG